MVDEELCTLGLLLSDLFLLDSLSELRAEVQVCNRYIIKYDVEVSQTLCQTLTNTSRDLLSLSEKLSGVISGYDGLEYLVDDGGQHAAIVVHTQVTVKLRQISGIRTEQDSQ